MAMEIFYPVMAAVGAASSVGPLAPGGLKFFWNGAVPAAAIAG